MSLAQDVLQSSQSEYADRLVLSGCRARVGHVRSDPDDRVDSPPRRALTLGQAAESLERLEALGELERRPGGWIVALPAGGGS
jgi:hypothetical protein